MGRAGGGVEVLLMLAEAKQVSGREGCDGRQRSRRVAFARER
jgi:hypothetical protein